MIEFTLPDEIENDLGRLSLEGSVSFDKPDGDTIKAKWTLDGDTVNVTYNLATRTVSVPNNTPKKRWDFIEAEIAKYGRKRKREAGIQKLLDVAQKVEGKSFEQLSTDELNTMLKLIMLRALEFDENGEAKVKPLKRWVKHLKNG